MGLDAVRLEGPRVVVRTTTLEDAPSIVAYFERNRGHLEPWEPGREAAFYTEAFWAARIRNYDEERVRGTAHRFCIATDQVIGLISMMSIIARAPVWNARVGYSLDKAHEGQGIMSEALGLVIRYAWGELGLRRLLAGYVPHNERSARVLERAGFVREGYHREFLYVGGKWEDHIETSLVNTAWRLPTA